jgi:hypothetical protein
MRLRRHTTAYAPSWQPSGNRAAPHRHSSELNAPDKKGPDAQPGPRTNAVFAPPNCRQRVGGEDARGGSDQRTQPLYLIRRGAGKKPRPFSRGAPI